MIIINIMIKKILIGFLSIFIINFAIQIAEKPSNIFNKIFVNTAQAEEVLKIKSINFDNSDSMIFLGTVPSSQAVNSVINKGKLLNPERVYFDIENTILAKPNSTYELKNSVIKQIKIAQFSTNPNVVRVVIEGTSALPSDKIAMTKEGTGFIIKYKNTNPSQNYLTRIYSDKDSRDTLFAKTTAQEIISVKKDYSNSNEVFDKIQKAFSETTEQTSAIVTNQLPETVPKQTNTDYRLKSRYHIDRAIVKEGNLLISGIGLLSTNEPFYLANPSRVVFDFENTTINPDIKGAEIKITETETAKIGQFSPTTARIVITTQTPKLYIPVFSNDMQNLLIANKNKIANLKLINTPSTITSIIGKAASPTTNNLIFDFSDPIVHSIERNETSLVVYLYNVGITPTAFQEKVAQTPFSGATITPIQNQGVKITIPATRSTRIECYESLNATELKISLKNLAEQVNPPTVTTPAHTQTPKVEQQKPVKPACPIESLSGRIIYIDPGHGGADTGALKSGIAEKDINLDIAKKTAAILTKKGHHVELTRWQDSTVSLQERVEMANTKDTDIFVSIHINSSVKPEVYGIETHYYTENGYEVARIIHKNIMNKVTGKDRGLFKSKFYVINHTEAPSVLLELGFISNDNERNALLTEERKNKSAEAVADGIIEYLKTQQKRTRVQKNE